MKSSRVKYDCFHALLSNLLTVSLSQERKVIIISTVRSSREFVAYDLRHTLGFVANPRRFNGASAFDYYIQGSKSEGTHSRGDSSTSPAHRCRRSLRPVS